ncbi:eukaryotic translation initiation factor 2d [Limosa lapponica baueri]|uniref:Eukaryotic translation initiation factor 2d n=1 Tax=Limosa lapponica baueri TaxID=1758121 RepID=A0A2I0TEM3_LIMLA|nr:eukaryotic translation initiation factor 2d [Limosa lapponica baueri]
MNWLILWIRNLMLPGVVVPSSGFPQVERGTLCAVTLLGNRAPVAVAVATMATAEMLAAGMKGKGFAVLHTYLDHLWEYGDKSYPPTLAPLVTDSAEKESAEDEEEMEGNEPVSSFSTDPLQHVDVGDLSLKERDCCGIPMGKEELHENRAAETAEDANTEVQQEAEDSRTPQEQMDALFNQCFFHALKCKVKKSDLPLLTSTFLRSHMFSCWYVVTIIKNLELYGLDPQCVANVLQQKVQASATITPVPGTKDRVQVQIQGNQVHHLAKMLLEEYQLPRKYIQGLEKAPKLGRKK